MSKSIGRLYGGYASQDDFNKFIEENYDTSQLPRNASQKGDLTSQWRKGELPEGWYYVIKKGDVEMLEYSCNCFLAGDVPLIDNEVTEVLAPVPSYEEWKDLKSKLQLKETAYDFDTARLEEENAQLKETVEALESELKEVCDVLIRKCPEMKEWVMMNWKNLYEVQDE